MKLYVLGCGGMLGTELRRRLTVRGHEVLATDIELPPFSSLWLRPQDVRDYESMRKTALEFKPDAILNLAAMTDLEECELRSQDAIETNAVGSDNCAVIAAALHIPYVYISTAGIFDGKQEFYTEQDVPHPLNWYGISKYWGELLALESPMPIVLRCGWQMGSGSRDKKFIQKIWQQIRRGATELNVVTDKAGTPTYVVDFTNQIEKLLETQSYGVFNAVCGGDATRFDVATEFVRLLGLTDRIRINAVSSDFFANEFPAPRPASEKLLTTKLDSMGLNVMRPWWEALAEYVLDYEHYFSLENI